MNNVHKVSVCNVTKDVNGKNIAKALTDVYEKKI